MKIGLLLPSVYMGAKYKNRIFAPKQLFLGLADTLVERGNDVFVYASPDTITKARLISGDAELINRNFMAPKFRGLDRSTSIKNAFIAAKHEYELGLTIKAYLHAKENGVQIMHSYHDFMAYYINRLAIIPTVYTLHDPRPYPGHLEYWRFKHFQNDNYIFISKSQKKNFRNLVRSVGVVYHGIDTKKFSFGEEPGSYLAFLGRYIKEKGVIEAISAAKKVGLPLKMIGDDANRARPYYQERVLPQLKKGSIEDATFLGEADRSSFLKNAKALLFPIQWDEPFGMVMIEAMACGTPVIAFNRGSVSEIVRDGVSGFIIDPDNVNRPGKGSWIIKKQGISGLVEAIKRIGEIDRMTCRRHVEENFTVDKMVDGYEKIYEEILSK